jgi:hypothetical protein
MLSAIDACASEQEQDITVTSACDGTHSGPDDPHHRGEAYDIRTHDQADKHGLLAKLQAKLGERFFLWIEDEGQPNEHIHMQVKKGTQYP